MSRSKWKGPFIKKNLVKNFFFNANSYDSNKKIWSRNTIVLENFVGKTLMLHNGKSFKKIFIFRERVGYPLGSFCYTRKHNFDLKKINKKKNNGTKI